MEKITKYIFIAIIGTTCFTGLFMYNFGLIPFLEFSDQSENQSNDQSNDQSDDQSSDQSDDQNSETKTEVENVVLIVDFGNGSIKNVADISLDQEHDTVFDALEKYCVVDCDPRYEWGCFITEIDGIRQGGGNYWQYWVNDEYANVPANGYHLDDNDVIKWVFG